MITAKLVASLLTVIAGYTGYAIPAVPPEILTLSHEALAQQVCGKPCGVVAFTMPDGRILLDDAVAVGRDPVGTSILVHELTHFLQIHAAIAHEIPSGPSPTPSIPVEGAPLSVPLNCQEWNAREREAYDVQFRWLRETAPTMRVLSLEMSRLGKRPILPAC